MPSIDGLGLPQQVAELSVMERRELLDGVKVHRLSCKLAELHRCEGSGFIVQPVYLAC